MADFRNDIQVLIELFLEEKGLRSHFGLLLRTHQLWGVWQNVVSGRVWGSQSLYYGGSRRTLGSFLLVLRPNLPISRDRSSSENLPKSEQPDLKLKLLHFN